MAALVGITLAFVYGTPAVSSSLYNSGFYGHYLEKNLPIVALTSTAGNRLALSDFEGRSVYLMFGYLGCDRICHTQSLSLQLLARSLPAEEVAFVFIALNPEQDTPRQVADFFEARGSNFIGLLPSNNRHARQIALAFDAPAHWLPTRHDGAYAQRIVHPGWVYLIDPQGMIRLLYSGATLDSDRLLADWQRLRRTPPASTPNR